MARGASQGHQRRAPRSTWHLQGRHRRRRVTRPSSRRIHSIRARRASSIITPSRCVRRHRLRDTPWIERRSRRRSPRRPRPSSGLTSSAFLRNWTPSTRSPGSTGLVTIDKDRQAHGVPRSTRKKTGGSRNARVLFKRQQELAGGGGRIVVTGNKDIFEKAHILNGHPDRRGQAHLSPCSFWLELSHE